MWRLNWFFTSLGLDYTKFLKKKIMALFASMTDSNIIFQSYLNFVSFQWEISEIWHTVRGRLLISFLILFSAHLVSQSQDYLLQNISEAAGLSMTIHINCYYIIKEGRDILCSDTRHKSRLSNVMFFTPLWRTIKNSGRAAGSASGQEDRLERIITKWKRNKNLKMPSFCAVFNCSNRADREKDKSNYRFP